MHFKVEFLERLQIKIIIKYFVCSWKFCPLYTQRNAGSINTEVEGKVGFRTGSMKYKPLT